MSALAFADSLFRDAAALLLIKVTAVLVLACGVAAVAKGLSAARRHTLWLVALASCVLLALSSPVVPAILIHAPLFAQNTGPATPRETVGAPARSIAATIAGAPRAQRRSSSSQSAWRRAVGSMPAPAHPLLAIWIAGCVLLLARDAIGLSRAMQLARRAVVVDDRDMMRLLAGAAATVASRRQIALAYSASVESPIAFGVANPVILLPTEARSWSVARRRAVLVHEAAHVSRGDCIWQAIGRLACEMFWFHPLAWRAFAHLRNDAERAADDCVLNSGIPAIEYASHVLDLARRATNERLGLLAVGIITPTHLERRFTSMLDSTRSRATVSARARAATMAFALVMIGPLASLRVGGPAPNSRASLRQVSRPVVAGTTRPPIAQRRASQIARVAATLPAMHVRAAAIESPLPPIAVIASATPSALTRPNLSGKWTSDTTPIHTLEFDWVVSDSLILTQANDAISIEGRGHIMTSLPRRLLSTQNSFSKITFDGAPSTGYTLTGNGETNVTVEAVWVADTLMLTSHARSGHVLYTIERMWLSADGQTLFETNRSFVDGKDRWGGLTFIWHRMAS